MSPCLSDERGALQEIERLGSLFDIPISKAAAPGLLFCLAKTLARSSPFRSATTLTRLPTESRAVREQGV